MAQQTALQQLIEWAISLKYNSQKCTDWICIKEKAEELLQMEKEQIMDAVERGFNVGCYHPEDRSLKNAEHYYNETFGKL